MFESQVIHSGNTVFSPWFPRGGDYLIASADVSDSSSSSPTLTIQVFTKNREDTGDGTDASATTGTKIDYTSGATGIQHDEWPGGTGASDGIKELVRYKFSVTGGTASDWFLFRMLPPVWFDAVKA